MQFYKFFIKFWGIILNTVLPLSSTEKNISKISAQDLNIYSEEKRLTTLKNTLYALNYQDEKTRLSIWSLKFKNNQKIAKVFAQIIYDFLIEELAELKLSHNFDKPLLIPIPLSRERLRERGYNQVELMAQELFNLDKGNSFDYRKNILKKIKNTTSQSHTHSKKERENNLKNCFKVVMPKLIKNRNIILLDDVITTGATLNEAIKTLKKHKPKKIICVALAH